MRMAVPLAAVAKAAAPEWSIVAGGGLELEIGELAATRRERLHIVVIVLQDESLALIKLKQENMRCGVGLGKTCFAEIAVAFGGRAVRDAERGAFAEELVRATRRDMFGVIVRQVEASDYVDGI